MNQIVPFFHASDCTRNKFSFFTIGNRMPRGHCWSQLMNLPCKPGKLYCFLFYIVNNECISMTVCVLYIDADIDECHANPCEDGCINTIGSYRCTCKTGFIPMSSGRCVDLDECGIGVPSCFDCINTIGRYAFFLNKSLPARLKATTRQEASRRDRTDFTKTERDIGWY